MKAIVLTEYGSPDVLELQEITKPCPKDDEVLIKVHATTVNDWDWCFVRGKPYAYRLFFGLLKPKVSVLGAEVAGAVEAVGKNVTEFQPGDDVYGDISESGFGGFAEYVCVRKDALSSKPAEMTFEQAAATTACGNARFPRPRGCWRDSKRAQGPHQRCWRWRRNLRCANRKNNTTPR